jgi:hypothetical protein
MLSLLAVDRLEIPPSGTIMVGQAAGQRYQVQIYIKFPASAGRAMLAGMVLIPQPKMQLSLVAAEAAALVQQAVAQM